MLRLREVITVDGETKFNADGSKMRDADGAVMFEPDTLQVVFEGMAGASADVRITLHMNLRPDDVTLLFDAQQLLRRSVEELHRELGAQASPATS